MASMAAIQELFVRIEYAHESCWSNLAHNKALKPVRDAHWTPSTGAASQYRAGFSRRLTPS